MLTEHVRFFISSHATSAKQVLHYVRGHWNIENQLHWPLDVIFCEDISTIRDVYGIQNIATLKSTALSLLLQNDMKISTRGKRARAAPLDHILCKYVSIGSRLLVKPQYILFRRDFFIYMKDLQKV